MACKAVSDPELEQGGNTNMWCAATLPPETRLVFSSAAGAILDGPCRSTSYALADA